MSEAKPLVMYIFVNSDLNMRKGKTAAQVGHVVQKVTAEVVRMVYELSPPPKQCFDYLRWEKEPTKVVLRASTEQLRDLMKMKEARHFIDSGNGIPDNSLTVVGFFPGTDLEELVKNYKLL